MTGIDPIRRLLVGVSLAASVGVGLCVARLERPHPTQAAPLDRMGVVLTGRAAPGKMVVESLSSGGQAQRAGVRVGDVVETVNGGAARTQGEVDRALLVRTPVDFRLRRGDTSLHLLIAEPGNGIGQQDPAGRGRRVDS